MNDALESAERKADMEYTAMHDTLREHIDRLEDQARADEEAMREVESIIELADHRASACDGPVGRTELSVKDLRRIYRLMKKRLKAREKGEGRE